MSPRIEKSPFGKAADGSAVDLYELVNSNGAVARITNYGAIVTALLVPDRAGKLEDVVLGYDTLDEYLADTFYLGCVAGRYANRIANGKFTLGGRTYSFAQNNGQNHLHGGVKGFNKQLWTARPIVGTDRASLELQRLSRDGEEGYPGSLSVKVAYSLTDRNELQIDYTATTDMLTVCNLTHHGYFNLDGAAAGEILGHELTIAASRFTPVDACQIPTGDLREVAGTPMDFRQSAAIGARIESGDQQLALCGGYDHNWVIDSKNGELTLAATVESRRSGRVMEVLTKEPGIQFYSGNFLDGRATGKGGVVLARRCGLCLETQHFPDSPNHPEFPSTSLEPGATYETTTIYRFTTR